VAVDWFKSEQKIGHVSKQPYCCVQVTWLLFLSLECFLERGKFVSWYGVPYVHAVLGKSTELSYSHPFILHNEV
jgi:hypothetical protein